MGEHGWLLDLRSGVARFSRCCDRTPSCPRARATHRKPTASISSSKLVATAAVRPSSVRNGSTQQWETASSCKESVSKRQEQGTHSHCCNSSKDLPPNITSRNLPMDHYEVAQLQVRLRYNRLHERSGLESEGFMVNKKRALSFRRRLWP